MEQLKNAFRKYEEEVYNGLYAQFTIDFIQNTVMDMDDISEDCHDEDYVQATLYRIENVIEVIKEGKDKVLFIELKNAIENGN